MRTSRRRSALSGRSSRRRSRRSRPSWRSRAAARPSARPCPTDTAEPRISGLCLRRLDADGQPGHVDGRADKLRVPVGALSVERRASERLELRRDRRCHDDAVRRRRRGRRIPASRARDRDERRRLRAPSRRTRRPAIAAPDTGRPVERPGADAQRHRRAGPDPPGQPRHVERPPADHVHVRLAALRHGRQQLRRAARASTTTRTSCARGTSARRSAPA